MARQHILRDIAANGLDPRVKYNGTRNGRLSMKQEAVVAEAQPAAATTTEKPVEKPVVKKPVVTKPLKAEEPAKPAPKAEEKVDEKKDA
jgi:hypothetical protein